MEKFVYDKWPRKEAYEFFSRLSDPFYMVSFEQDVTDLYEYTRSHDLSFYYGMVWACMKAVNEVEAFHLVIKDGELFYLEKRTPSFTDLKKGAEQFHIVTMEMIDDIALFCEEARRLSSRQEVFLHAEKESDELVYLSSLPWIDLLSLTNERDREDPAYKDDSIPRIAWGRFNDKNGRKVLGISLEVNHRLIDGLHIGRFAQALSEVIKGLNGEDEDQEVSGKKSE